MERGLLICFLSFFCCMCHAQAGHVPQLPVCQLNSENDDKRRDSMENQNSSYSVQIGKTTFIVCVKQSETAKKPIEKMFKDMCRHEVTRDFLADNLMNLEKLPKTS